MDYDEDHTLTKESLNSLSTDILFSDYLGLAVKVVPENIEEIQHLWTESF